MSSADTPVETLAHRAGAAFAAYQGGDRQRLAELVDLVTPLLWPTKCTIRLSGTCQHGHPARRALRMKSVSS